MRVVIVSAVIVLLDQFTKLLVKGFSVPALRISIEGMKYGTSREVLGDFFRITYIENPGMAFGIDVGAKPFLAIVSLVASIAIAAYLYRSRNEPLGYRFSLAMILGGAVGNLIDRLFYGILFGGAPLFHGRVVDFLDVDFFNVDVWGYHLSRWPVFNVADASVTIGVALLLVLYRGGSPRKEPLPQPEGAATSSGLPLPAPNAPEQN